jgi:outer membrane receptor protein involved in Fe transport
MINQSQSVVLSYTQRLRRPGIWFLNPYVDDNDKYNISYGNPDLESVKAHSFNAQYRMFTPSSSLFLGANFSFSNNSITEITTVETATDPDTGEVYDRTSRTYGNIGKERRIGFNASYSYRLGAVFSVNANLRGAYTFMESMNYDRPLKNEGLNFGGNLGAYVTLWKGARFSVNGGIFSRGVSLQGRSSIFNHTSFGLTQKLFKEKMDISVSVSNPFSKFQKWESWSEDSTFKTHSKFENTGRRINFYIGWRFGKTEIQVKKARRGINNDDSLENGSSPSNVPTSTQTGTQNGAR